MPPEEHYNGLNRRILKRAFLYPIDQQRLMYYSANWQLLEERIDDDFDAQTPGTDRHMQYVWGPRYIDDIIARRQNSNFGNDSPDITYEDVWYHLTDAQFSTVAIINDDADLIERVSYDAYGKARHHRLGDLNGDGATTSADSTLLMANIDGYGIGDLDRDGVVTFTDRSILSADLGAALPAGQLSSGGDRQHHRLRGVCVQRRARGRWVVHGALQGVLAGPRPVDHARSAGVCGWDGVV